jgi:hypothetical protein
MAPEARVVHRTRGRLRLRVPARIRNQAYFERVCRTLSESSAVTEVAANPITGSVLVLHEDDAEVVLALGAEQGLFRVAERPAARPPVLVRGYAGLQAVDRQITARSRHRLDLPTATFYALAAAGTLQLLRGDVLPAGLTLYSTATALLLAVGRPGTEAKAFGRDSASDASNGGHGRPAT